MAGSRQAQGQGKKVLTPGQKAALAKGRAKRATNLAARRASRARQGASSQVSTLPALARDALQQPQGSQGQVESQQPNDAHSPSASSTSSSPTTKRLSQDEQDALLFSFAMGDDDEHDENPAAAASSSTKSSVGDKLAGLLTKEGPKTSGNQQEDDAQQAAAQWQDLAAVGFIFICSQIFSADLAPSDKQAQAMAAPLCRILMRHVAPLRQASADAYDIAAFAGAVLIYYQSISPELARRRAERKVTHVAAQAQQSSQASRSASGQPAVERGNVRILHPEDTPGRRRYDGEPLETGGVDVRQDEQQPYRGDAGAAIISETLGVEL